MRFETKTKIPSPSSAVSIPLGVARYFHKGVPNYLSGRQYRLLLAVVQTELWRALMKHLNGEYQTKIPLVRCPDGHTGSKMQKQLTKDDAVPQCQVLA